MVELFSSFTPSWVEIAGADKMSALRMTVLIAPRIGSITGIGGDGPGWANSRFTQGATRQNGTTEGGETSQAFVATSYYQ